MRRFLPALMMIGAAASAAEPAVKKGLVVHEWGVFNVHRDVASANADLRLVWDALPGFVYGQIKGRRLPQHWEQIEARDRPLVFFHSAEPVDVKMRVDFPGGLAGVWWPGTAEPALRQGRPTPAAPVGTLKWDLRIKQAPPARRAPGALALVPKGHWIEAARAVGADDVFSRVGEQGFGYEREKFIYYDGVFPRAKGVDVKLVDGKAVLVNSADHVVFDVTVVDRRADGSVRLATLAKLDAGMTSAPLSLDVVNTPDFVAWASKRLAGQLTDAGLFDAEAALLVDLWKKDLYGTVGVHLHYRIPQATYDKLLPLTLEPRPEKTVRVGLVVFAHCAGDMEARLAALVKQLDDDAFAKREAASDEIARMGGSAISVLRKLEKSGDLSAEVKSRLTALLDRIDSERALGR